MKFEYDSVNYTPKEMVAFIDDEGDLCIKVGDGLAYLLKEGAGFAYDESDFEDYACVNGIKKSFYPGDKITITF